ncbi:hypothetical protein OGAPHI_004813 [Ogataea philodendri]|uniref:Uncharacterized protein n=1 Tax=Ogataea philodendri TaxID=1378263 RepID=A0A9P8T3E3_9ASCO|nr:uncharacterized protein OGAPHI_004813 [Ogataea philodendri]KAH3664099.1 hypothetical protein OGAPHI_004813 [Ogataea philodendri]
MVLISYFGKPVSVLIRTSCESCGPSPTSVRITRETPAPHDASTSNDGAIKEVESALLQPSTEPNTACNNPKTFASFFSSYLAIAEISAAKPAAEDARPAAVGKLFSLTMCNFISLNFGSDESAVSSSFLYCLRSFKHCCVLGVSNEWDSPLSQSESFSNDSEHEAVVRVLKSFWDNVTLMEEFVGRLRSLSLFPHKHVPNSHCSVSGTRNQLGSVREKVQRVDVLLVSLQVFHNGSGSKIPDSDDLILSTSGKELAVWREAHRSNIQIPSVGVVRSVRAGRRLVAQSGNQVSSFNTENLGKLVAAGGQELTVCREPNTANHRSVIERVDKGCVDFLWHIWIVNKVVLAELFFVWQRGI